MVQYDFNSLSPYDFELLIRDLMQAELGINLESYKQGKDSGIDLRGYTANKVEPKNALDAFAEKGDQDPIIIQCKHYANSKFSNLLAKIRDEESEKVRKLKPSSYFLVTSLSLSAQNKDKLFALLPDYFKTTANIIGQEDINKYLNKHKDIERRHFKLWLTSINILENILHSGIVNRSDAKIRSIREKIKLYVQNDSYKKATEILQNKA